MTSHREQESPSTTTTSPERAMRAAKARDYAPHASTSLLFGLYHLYLAATPDLVYLRTFPASQNSSRIARDASLSLGPALLIAFKRKPAPFTESLLNNDQESINKLSDSPTQSATSTVLRAGTRKSSAWKKWFQKAATKLKRQAQLYKHKHTEFHPKAQSSIQSYIFQ